MRDERLYARQISLREAIQVARRLGCAVDEHRGDGEIEFSHPGYFRRVRINGRRKDTPRVVMTMLRAIAEGVATMKPPSHVVAPHPLLRRDGHVAPAPRLRDHDRHDR